MNLLENNRKIVFEWENHRKTIGNPRNMAILASEHFGICPGKTLRVGILDVKFTQIELVLICYIAIENGP